MNPTHNESQLRGLASRELFFDRILLGVCSLALIVVIILLISDFSLFHRTNSNSAEIVARIAEATNSVRRRAAGLPVWSRASKGEAVQDKDQVFTDEDSSTVIRFIDGSEVLLSENTLVTVQKQESRTQFNVLRGALAAKSGGGDVAIEIDVGGMKTKVQDKNTEINVKRDGEGKTSIAVVGGKAEIASNGKVVELAADTVSQFSETGKLTATRRIPVRLLTPEDGQTVFFQKSAALRGPRAEFTWAPVNGVDQFELQIARDNAFKQTVFKKAFNGTSGIAALDSGKYFWRVGAWDSGSRGYSYSIERRVTLEEDRAPRLWKPESNVKVAFKELLDRDEKARAIASLQGGTDGTRVQFFWEEVGGVRAYAFQLASDREFTSVLFEDEVKTNNLVSTKLLSGPYFWRVRNIEKSRPSSPWSVARGFTVQKISLPGAPAGLLPTDGALLKLDRQQPAIVFRWERDELSHTYLLQVARDKSFETPIAQQKVRGSSWTWLPPEIGEYYWRVRAWDEYERMTPYAERQDFEVEVAPVALLGPEPETVLTLVTQKTPIRFRWEKSPLLDRYVLQIAKDNRFRDRVAELPSNVEAADWAELSVGKFYWRVMTYVKGRPDPIESTVRELEIVDLPLPEPPKLSPKIEIEIDAHFDAPAGVRHSVWGWIREAIAGAKTKNEPKSGATIKWGKVEGAVAYLLELSRDESFEVLVTKKTLASPVFEWTGASPGRYYMRIATIDQYKRKGPYSNVSTVLVRPNPPELLLPQLKLAVSEEKKATLFSWSPVENSSEYEIQIAKDKSFSSVVEEEKTSRSKFEFFLEESGNYFWRVRALGPNGLDTHFSESRPLAYTYAYIPRSEQRAGPVVTPLRWSRTRNARAYRLQISKDPDFSRPLVIKTTRRNSASVPLEPGEYYWRVGPVPKKGKAVAWNRVEKIHVHGGRPGIQRGAASLGESTAVLASPSDPFMLIFSGGYAPSINNYSQSSTDPTLYYSGLNFMGFQGELEFWYQPAMSGIGIYYSKNNRTLFYTGSQPSLSVLRNDLWVGAVFRWPPLFRKPFLATTWRFGYQYKNLPTFQTATSTTLKLLNNDVHYLKGSAEIEFWIRENLSVSARAWFAKPIANNNIRINSSLNLRFDVRAQYFFYKQVFADFAYTYDYNRFTYSDDGDILTGGRVTGSVRDDNQMVRFGIGLRAEF
ncbi:MAG: FecR domain-containing protein [Bdellovibrionales bacterium]|nr:FecR domain-containing protein [Bdellovibrionales bacterium]